VRYGSFVGQLLECGSLGDNVAAPRRAEQYLGAPRLANPNPNPNPNLNPNPNPNPSPNPNPNQARCASTRRRARRL
jgi:hypothetical protein